MEDTDFEWDAAKNLENQQKHGVSFYESQYAFFDPRCLIAEDTSHSQNEKRYFFIGKDSGKTEY